MSDETKQEQTRESVETMQEQSARDQERGLAEDAMRAAEASSHHGGEVDLAAVQDRLGQEFDDDVAEALESLAERAAEIDRIEEELEQTKDQLMRQAASFQNYRRRTQQEMERLAAGARADVLRQLLDVLDDFERTVDVVEQNKKLEEIDFEQAYQSLSEGVALVHRKFVDELQRLDVEPIEAEGEPFDENLHDAMMQQPAPEGTKEGTVLQEVQRGYRMGDRVLRHSKVIVAS